MSICELNMRLVPTPALLILLHFTSIRFAPPLVISEEDLMKAVKIIGECLRDLDLVRMLMWHRFSLRSCWRSVSSMRFQVSPKKRGVSEKYSTISSHGRRMGRYQVPYYLICTYPMQLDTAPMCIVVNVSMRLLRLEPSSRRWAYADCRWSVVIPLLSTLSDMASGQFTMIMVKRNFDVRCDLSLPLPPSTPETDEDRTDGRDKSPPNCREAR